MYDCRGDYFAVKWGSVIEKEFEFLVIDTMINFEIYGEKIGTPNTDHQAAKRTLKQP